MSMTNLGFRDLQYVVAVAQCGSITRAAEACSITQPALSERIKRIESTLGIQIFERVNRVTRVTPVGDRLVAKARQLLDEAIEIDAALSSEDEPLSSSLHVGIITTLGPFLMPHVLPLMRKRYPKMKLVLHEGLTETLHTKLLAGSLDMIIATRPLNTSGINDRVLFEEPFVLAAPVDHKLASQKTVKATDLCGDDMVLLEDGHCLSGQALDVCPAKQRQNRKRLHAMTLETLRHMVATGAGYTLLPSLAVGARPPLRKLIRYRNLEGKQQYGRTVVLAWRKSFGRKTDVEHFARLILDSLPDNYGLVVT